MAISHYQQFVSLKLFASAILGVLLVGSIVFWMLDPNFVQQINLDKDNWIIIRGPSRATGICLTYEVWNQRRPSRLPHYFGTSHLLNEEQLFDVLILNNGKLIGVYHKNDPHLLFIMYDMESGKLWPLNDGLGGNEAERRDIVGTELVKRIREVTKDGGYRFDYYPGP